MQIRRPQYSAEAGVIFGDDFNDNSLDAGKWTRIGAVTGFTVTETGGQSVQTNSGAGSGADGLVSVNAWDLTNRKVRIKGVSFPGSSATHSIYFIVIDGSGRYFGFVISNFLGVTNLTFEHNNGSNNDTSIPYDAVNHLWIRLRHDSGADTMYWETSPDNVTWTARRTVTSWNSLGFTMTAMKIRMQFNTTATSGSVTWDDIALKV
jgi:hypothetical protein